MEILQYCQKLCWVFDLDIRLAAINEKVGIGEHNGNKCGVSTVFTCNSSWGWLSCPNFN